MLHYFIVILIILVIIGVQTNSYIKTKKKIRSYRSIFPSELSAYSLNEIILKDDNVTDEDEEDNEVFVSVSQIKINSESSTLKEIVLAINKYLQKNRGAASDFHLMKDVVERYCDAESDQISTQQPIPLYLGLMGTMFGIIIGIGSIAFSGGLTSVSLMSHITELMVCVATAMAASLAGVYFTTRIAWQSKEANSEVEADKNKFYSWLQTELLPVLSGNTANAIHLLQQNLLTFNTSFKRNIDGLSSALAKISDASHEQVELIQLIRDIDIRRVAQANIQVLRELNSCTGEITRFNTYLHSVSGYLDAVNALNSNINEHLNRTAAIERMGSFFEREIEQVQTREQYINQVVANVDNTLRDTFNALRESTENGVQELRRSSATEFETLKDTLTEEKQAFRDSLISKNSEFADFIREQKELLSQRTEEILALTNEIRSLSDTKNAMERIVQASNEQNQKLDRMIELLRKQSIVAGGKNGETIVAPGNLIIPKWIRFAIAFIVLFLFCILSLKIVDLMGIQLPMGDSSNKNKIEMIDEPTDQQQATDINQTVFIEEDQISDVENPAEEATQTDDNM